MYYITNLEEYREINTYQKVEKNDILSLIKTDVSGFSFPVMFLVKDIEEDKQYLEIEAFMPKYGRVLDIKN